MNSVKHAALTSMVFACAVSTMAVGGYMSEIAPMWTFLAGSAGGFILFALFLLCGVADLLLLRISSLLLGLFCVVSIILTLLLLLH